MFDPSAVAIKLAVLAIKAAVKFIRDSLRLPIVHWDPALQNAHVLLLAR